MQLVESYLVEVEKFLPADQREEILSELRGSLEEEVYESSGDSDPGIEIQAAVLRRFGHPLKVASMYQPDRALVGSDLFPAFKHTLKYALVVAYILFFIAAFVYAQVTDWRVGPLDFFWSSIEVLIWVLAIVVLVFVAIEYSGEKLGWYEKWRPEALAIGNLGVIKRSDVLTNLFSEGFFLFWWNDVFTLQDWVPAVGEKMPLSLAPIWQDYFWFLNILFSVAFVLHAYVLVVGLWRFRTLVAEIVVNTALIALGVCILMTPELVTFAEEFPNGVRINIDRIAHVVVAVIMAVTLWDIWLAFKQLRGRAS